VNNIIPYALSESTTKKLQAFFACFFYSLFFAYPISTFITKYVVGAESNIISILARSWVFFLGIIAIYLNIKFRQFLYSGTFLLFVVFWIIYAARILYDTTQNPELLGSSPSLYFTFAILLSFITTIGCFTKVAFWRWKYFDMGLLVILALLNIMMLYNTITTPSEYIIEKGFRFEGNERLNPITAGMLASFLLVFIAVKLHDGKIRFSNVLLYLLLVIISAVNLVVTLSKGPIIFSLIAIVLIASRLVGANQLKRVAGIMLSVLLLFALISYLNLGDIFSLVLDRFAGISGKDESTAERLLLYNNAWEQFLRAPFTGDFLEERVLRIYPHNMVLESLMALGIFGGILFVAYYSVCGIRIGLVLIRTRIAIVPLIVFYGFISSTISGSLSMGPEIWYCLSLANALYFHYTSTLEKHTFPSAQHIHPLSVKGVGIE
jgi:O-antigen ligase